MDELCDRFRQAAEFLKRCGFVKNYGAIADRIGVTRSTVSECMGGVRMPTWGMLLDFCDAYPVNFWWLRTGAGAMVKGEAEQVLLKRIEELEEELRTLRE